MDLKSVLLVEWSRLTALLANPRSHPREALIVYGIMAALVLVFLVILGLATSRAPAAPAGDPSARRTRESNGVREVLLGLESVATAAIIFVVAFGVGTYFPQACNTCHGNSDHYATWRGSTHKTVACRRCHWGPGAAGSAQAEFDVARMVVVWARKTEAIPRAGSTGSIPSGACRACHGEIEARTTRGRVSVSHRELSGARYPCTSCHPTTGHGPKGRTKAMTMNLCLECHDGKRAGDRCDICHPRRGFAPDPGISAGDYPKATISRRDCEGCHSTAACTKCHGIYLPHPFDYAPGRGHARDGFTRRDLCLRRCHTTTDCSRCHHNPGTHGRDWKTAHGETATPYCNIACHHQSFVAHLPGVTPSATFCDNCHPGRVPKPRGGGAARANVPEQ